MAVESLLYQADSFANYRSIKEFTQVGQKVLFEPLKTRDAESANLLRRYRYEVYSCKDGCMHFYESMPKVYASYLVPICNCDRRRNLSKSAYDRVVNREMNNTSIRTILKGPTRAPN